MAPPVTGRKLLAVPLIVGGLFSILACGYGGVLPLVRADIDSATTSVGLPVNLTVLANDKHDSMGIASFTQAVDEDGNIQPGSVKQVGSYSDSKLQYTPPEGFTGTVTFTYFIEGHGQSYKRDSTSNTTVTVTVEEETPENIPPTARFSVTPETPEVDQTVTLNAGASTDTDGSIVSYEWDFQNDGSFDATQVTTETAYSTAGTFTARLRVTDDAGATDETTREITVTESSGNGSLAGTYHGDYEPGMGFFDLTIGVDETISLTGEHELLGTLSGGGSIAANGQLVDVSATGSGGGTLTMAGTFNQANGGVMGQGTWTAGESQGTWSAE